MVDLSQTSFYQADTTSLRGPPGDKGEDGAPGKDGVPSYRIMLYMGVPPGNAEVLLEHIVTDLMVLPDNFAGSRASAGFPPAATYVLAVLQNGFVIGSITIAPDGSGTLATEGEAAVVFNTGDILAIRAPLVDADTLGRLRVTLKATFPTEAILQ